MRQTRLGPFSQCSRLTLGGGGLGQIWGKTSPEEARAAVYAALDAGITVIDTAPMYNACEALIASTFSGALPTGVRITSKCWLGEPAPGVAARQLEASLDASLKAMNLPEADIFFLHSNLCEDDAVYPANNDQRGRFATPWTLYVEEVAPALAALKQRGRIGAWGITGVGRPAVVLKALRHTLKPDVVQAVANLLDSPGGMRRYPEAPRPREIIAAAQRERVGVMGIRAVQAGALTAAIDRDLKATHPESVDYRRAAPYRALCSELGADPALLAHRYALGLEGVDTLVLGVKNRAELDQCLEAEALGPLPPDLQSRIDELGLRSAEGPGG